jgi:hypothetical protein
MKLHRSPFHAACWVFAFSICLRSVAAHAQALVAIGQNFTASTYNVDVTSLPPDPNGAIGPHHFVEFINGSFAVYNKTNSQIVKRVTDLHFWSTAGVVISPDDAVTDPRIIYDPAVQRWYASMVDASQSAVDPTLNANDFLFAVSAGADPTGAWHGFLFEADPDTGYFADFPTLGADSTAVYLSGDFYHGSATPIGPGLVSLPKADLLATTPTIANRTWFGVMDYAQRGQVLQPAICLDGSASGSILAVTDIGNDSSPHSNLVSFAVQNAGGPGASLTAATFIPTASWVVPDNPGFGQPLLTPTQPDGTTALMANDARLSAKVYAVGGVLYAVNSTELNSRIAIRWYRVRASDNVLLESGTIADPDLDLFFPSIAANPYGVVTIAFNGCGIGTDVSCFALVGQTVNGVTSFGTRLLLQNGATSYHGDDEAYAELLGNPPFSRWGDYGATSVDPTDPNRFWTIQMLPSDAANSDVWSTQVTELVTTPQFPLTILPAGTNVTLSWSSGATGYQLQLAASIAPSATWSNVTQAPLTNGSQLYVMLPTFTRQQFFRLQKP